MVIPSEYIQIVSAGIYSIALFYTIITFRRTKKLDQISLLNKIFSDLRELDREVVSIPSESKYDDIRYPWYTRIFNSVNWLSFMVNENVINDTKMIEHIKPIIINYYESMFLTNASVDEKSSNSYQDFKKLYGKIKKSKEITK
ncbi:MAG TPA: hypothetical protein VN704_08190 [Verrucomicrobiae bacterium]|jgi:hypothetical protein|nr:hypothetical protein [Verrucomicrobiae bacterium]